MAGSPARPRKLAAKPRRGPSRIATRPGPASCPNAARIARVASVEPSSLAKSRQSRWLCAAMVSSCARRKRAPSRVPIRMATCADPAISSPPEPPDGMAESRRGRQARRPLLSDGCHGERYILAQGSEGGRSHGSGCRDRGRAPVRRWFAPRGGGHLQERRPLHPGMGGPSPGARGRALLHRRQRQLRRDHRHAGGACRRRDRRASSLPFRARTAAAARRLRRDRAPLSRRGRLDRLPRRRRVPRPRRRVSLASRGDGGDRPRPGRRGHRGQLGALRLRRPAHRRCPAGRRAVRPARRAGAPGQPPLQVDRPSRRGRGQSAEPALPAAGARLPGHPSGRQRRRRHAGSSQGSQPADPLGSAADQPLCRQVLGRVLFPQARPRPGDQPTSSATRASSRATTATTSSTPCRSGW